MRVLLIFSINFAEVSYRYVVDRQPIGKKLFEQFCSRDPVLKRAVHFLERLVSSGMKRGSIYALLDPTCCCILYDFIFFLFKKN